MVKRDTGLHLRSGCAAGFYHHGALTDSGCNYVPPRKGVFGRRPSWPELRDKGATGGNVLSEIGMLARIALGDTRSDHGDSPPAGLQGGAMSCRVNTAREARHDSDALSSEQTRHVRCPADALIGGLSPARLSNERPHWLRRPAPRQPDAQARRGHASLSAG